MDYVHCQVKIPIKCCGYVGHNLTEKTSSQQIPHMYCYYERMWVQ